MDILSQMLDDLWQRMPPDRMVTSLNELAGEIDQDTELGQWILVQLHLARAYTLQLEFEMSEQILQVVVDHLGSAMVRERTLYFIEKGRILIARGNVEQGLKRWLVAERVAVQHGLVDLADEATRLNHLYREMMVDTENFTYDEMKSYVQQSLLQS